MAATGQAEDSYGRDRNCPNKGNKRFASLDARCMNSAAPLLGHFDIASHLPHIKKGEKRILSAYGIEDACGRARQPSQPFPGFGIS